MRLVEPLKHLALHKLHMALMDFSLRDERIIHVMELARYAYEHGENRREDGIYRLGAVDIQGPHGLCGDVGEGGECVTDFWFIVVKAKLV
jgi:hypothetical protein